MNFRLVKCGRDRKHTTHKPQRGSSGKERVNNSRILRGSQREMFFRRPPATPSIKEGLRLLNLFQMNFFFSFTSSKREGISFPADGALEGSKRKAKQRVSPGSKNLEKNSKSARTNKSLRTRTRSRFRRDALSRLVRITNVESKSLSTHTRTQKERERERGREIFCRIFS